MSKLTTRLITRDRVIAVALIVTGGLLYLVAGSYPAGGSYFPQFSLGAVISLSALQLVSSFLTQRKSARSLDAVDRRVYLRPILLLLLFLVYLVIAPWLGFFATTALFTYTVMIFLKIRSLKYYLIFVPALMAALYIFFGMILKVPFPDSVLL